MKPKPKDRTPPSKRKPAAPRSKAPAVGGTAADAATDAPRPKEIGGRDGPDPTRYGDYEKDGRCVDF